MNAEFNPQIINFCPQEALLQIAAHQLDRLIITDVEVEAALLAVQGLSNIEIGDKLNISASAVQKRLSNVFEVTGDDNKTQLAGRAFGALLAASTCKLSVTEIAPSSLSDDQPRRAELSIQADLPNKKAEQLARASFVVLLNTLSSVASSDIHAQIATLPNKSNRTVDGWQEYMRLTRRRHAREYGLSNREQEVLDLIVEGLSSKDIAEDLGIHRSTAKDHIASILAKVGSANRTELVSQIHDIIPFSKSTIKEELINEHLSDLHQEILNRQIRLHFKNVGLLPEETEVAFWASYGLTNLQIEDAASLDTPAVRKHMAKILPFLGYTNRAELAYHSLRAGFTATARKLVKSTVEKHTEVASHAGEITEQRITSFMTAHGLVPREQKVSALAIRGMKHKQIGEQLSINRHTVGDDIRRVLKKTRSSTRAQLVGRLFGITRAEEIDPS